MRKYNARVDKPMRACDLRRMSSRQISIATALAFATLCSPAWAVFKCKDPVTGRTVFQERACEATGSKGQQIEIKPASGNAPVPTAAPAVASAAPKQTETERLKNLGDLLSKKNRLSEINNLEIKGAHGRINAANNNCQRKMEALQARKTLSNNNLAGATWEQSISAEMQAIAAMCGTEQQRHQASLDRVLAEKAQLEREIQMMEQ